MRILGWLGWLERALCALGFLVMTGALVLDVATRLILGHGLVGAAQLGLVGMLVTALFGVGLAADAGDHLRPRLLDTWRPARWEPGMVRIGQGLTGLFYAGMAVLSVQVAWESWLLADLTSLLRWPVWSLQSVFVLAFAGNAVRHLLLAVWPEAGAA